ncbi:N-6 DNA methylase [Flavobacterium sp. PLA-1-15]|uniref:N-6 DNA methylase n=1 Tax=Flavobacterium sp. PLA-1-15 TaxID=3380533 RepID=UPI003B7ADCAC
MLKTRDVPQALKEFNALFYALDKHHLSTVFDDLLTMIICAMGRGTAESLYFETIKRYDRKELDIFCRLFAELVSIYRQGTKENGICDPLGDYYECLASNYKKSNFGQFFTPFPICKLIAGLTNTEKDFGLKINEPCSGSGRMVLAMNQIAKGNYYICEDLDPICCKMTAINLCFHEIKAEIHCRDTLKQTEPRFSMATNYEFWKNNINTIFYYPSA